MHIETKIQSLYVMIGDVLAPERELAYHLDVVDVFVNDDGTRQVLRQRQLNMAMMKKEGLTLPAILADLNTAAVAAAKAAEDAKLKIEEELATASADFSKLATVAQQVLAARDAANRVAGDLAQELQAANAEKAALVAKIDELTAPSEEPSNPLLNKLSFGLLGN